MKKIILTLIIALTLVGCNSKVESEKIKVVSSFTIIRDMVEQIGQDLVEVYNIVPTGVDPHEHELLPNDIKEVSSADILMYNGLNLEGGKNGWFDKMLTSLEIEKDIVYNLSDNVTPKYLTNSNRQEEINPHGFLDPKVGMIMADNIYLALSSYDSKNQEIYQKNYQEYIKQLEAMDQKYHELIDSLPIEKRILVTSERAFQYMTESYGLKEAYIWAIDTEELGTFEQIKSLIEFNQKNNPPILFLESNVNPKPMETVSIDSNIEIFEVRLYSDEIGDKNDEVNTYLKMLDHNIETIFAGLSK